MEKLSIKNRKSQNIVVVVDQTTDQKGLAFVMHGLGGFKEQPQMQTFAEAFKEKGFTTVLFDTTNTFGESEGAYEDATITNYYEDLEDVIEWSKTQSWYQEPFVLAGHSLGGICTALYAEEHPRSVAGLAPISTVVSGQLSLDGYKKHDPEALAQWERSGWREEKSESKPGVIKRLPWSHMLDRMKYDLLPEAGKLTMPVLLIVGDKDTRLFDPIHLLYDALPGPKEIYVIEGAPHTFRDPDHLRQIKEIFLMWIGSL